MSRKLPPLNALRVFEAAARHQSFARAANELHVTPAAVSQQIRLLEDHLGTTLFKRGKSLSLSQSAEEILPLLTDAFDLMERAMLKVRAPETEGALIVSTPPAFAARWLIPRMGDFHALHPDIEVHMLATRRPVDFTVENVDMAIRFGSGEYPGVQVEQLMPESIVAVATPQIARTIRRPADLAHTSLIEDEWHTERGAFPEWGSLLDSAGITCDSLQLRRFSDANLAIQAAAAGLGVTLAWHTLVSTELKNGSLAQVLDQVIPTDLGYHVLTPGNSGARSKVATFRNWLLQQAAVERSA